MKRNTTVRSALLGLGLIVSSLTSAEVPPPHQLLPNDTLAVITIPDFGVAKQAFNEDSYVQLWRDASMNSFRDKFYTKLKADVIEPLEQQLGLRLSDYSGLLSKQVTLALFIGEGKDLRKDPPEVLLLLDAEGKADDLGQHLQQLQQKWRDADKPIRPQSIRGNEFHTIAVTGGNDDEKEAIEVTIGQSDSLLLVSSSPKIIEEAMVRQSGGSLPALEGQQDFQNSYRKNFRNAYAYGWLNFDQVFQVIEKLAQEATANQQEANFMAPKPTAIVSALGLSGLKSASFNLNTHSDGSSVRVALGLPEGERKGLFDLIRTEAKDSSPPPIVPANATQFSRMRLDLQKVWSSLEKMINEISPMMGGMLQMTLASVGKERDPNFDFRKSLIENLGDDIINFGLPPRSSKPQDLMTAPSMVLLGTPNGDELAKAVVAATGLVPSSGNVLKEREFLGRTIYSFSLPSFAPGGQVGAGAPQAGFHFVSSGGYLAISADEQLVESYLRSDSPSDEPLRSASGVQAAAERVGGMNTGIFTYENYSKVFEVVLEQLRNDSDAINELIPVPQIPGQPGAGEIAGQIGEWLDFSLLPPFERIAKFFHYTVGAATGDAQGVGYTMFMPTPPQLRN